MGRIGGILEAKGPLFAGRIRRRRGGGARALRRLGHASAAADDMPAMAGMTGMDHGGRHGRALRARRLRARRSRRHAANGFDPSLIVRDFDGGKVSTLDDGRTLREWHLIAVDKEIEIAPGVKYAAWTFNGRVPGPTLRCTEGDHLRIKFTNGSAHPHTVHFHGIHPSVDGRRAGPRRGDRRRADPAGPVVHVRVRRRAVRAAPLPLPRDAARGAHRQGPVRHVHRRPEGAARRRPTSS